MAIWSIPWALLGLVIGVFIRWFERFGVINSSPDWPLPVLLAFVGATTGAINGLVFGVLLMLSERNHRIADLRTWRVGGLAALASAGTTFLFVREPIVAAIAAVLGFAGGALSLRLAARPEHASAPAEAEQQEV